ncbi:MAG: aldo/keto reductase [Armatimonadota bacterium]
MTLDNTAVLDTSASQTGVSPLPLRPFGRGGEMLPVLGLGGQSLIQNAPDEDSAVEMIRRAVELGIRYIDTAPLYGESEARIGKAVEGVRERVFLATKTVYRRASSARRSLERSLQRLRTDYVDNYQLHCLMHPAEVDAVFARDGVIRMVEKAREEGIIRHVGVTGHFVPSVLSEMLRRYPFDSVLIPVNPADPMSYSFTADTLKVARETGASVVAMKVMGAGLLTHEGLDPAALLRYALSWPVSVAIVSCRSIADVEANVRMAGAFQPMSEEEMRSMEQLRPDLLARCNAIYKRHSGRSGLKLELFNYLASVLCRRLPGWKHF